MKNKKITSLLVAGVLTVGIVGGTLAWLTASDSVTNKFNTISGTSDKLDIDIREDFIKDNAKNLTPGAEVNKDVQVKNIANYDEFIRVKFIKTGIDNKNDHLTAEQLENIELILKNTSTDLTNGTWVANGEWYYYIGKVAANSHTNNLLDAVKINKNVTQALQLAGFDVKVDAESVQASNKAYADAWGLTVAPEGTEEVNKTSEQKLADKYAELESAQAQAPTDEEITFSEGR